MKILFYEIELAYGSLETNYSDTVDESFQETFRNLEGESEKDGKGYIHFKDYDKFFFDGITETDKQLIVKLIKEKATE